MTSFTYQLNPDALAPNGFAEPAQNTAQGLRSLFTVFVGVTTPASCAFTCAASPPGACIAPARLPLAHASRRFTCAHRCICTCAYRSSAAAPNPGFAQHLSAQLLA